MKKLKKILTALLILVILFYCVPVFSQSGWVQQTSGTTNILTSVFFINPSTGWTVGVFSILKTTNGGVNWFSQLSNNSIVFQNVYFINSSTGITVGSQGSIYKTYNSGNNWNPINSPTTNSLISVYFKNIQTGWAGGNAGTLITTTNQGENWALLPVFTNNNLTGVYFTNSTTGCVLAGSAPGIYNTTDGGLHWYSMATNGGNSLFFINSFTGWYCNNNILKTTDGGYNWTQQYTTSFILSSLFFQSQDTGWCTGDQGKIYNTTNGGSNWSPQLSGTTTVLNSIFFVNSQTGWTVGYNGKILKTTTGGIVGFERISNEVPKAFYLSQNYPNPFNPTTRIKFDIPSLEQVYSFDVRLVIYDILGREIAKLVNDQLKPGTYEVEWDAANYPGGVYFYRLETENFIQTRKLILLK